MINISKFIIGLKITWMRRLFLSQTYQWVHLFNTTICPLRKLTIYGLSWIKKIIQTITNRFWKDTLSAFIRVSNKQIITNNDDLLMVPLWYTQEILTNNFDIKNWVDNHIIFIKDIIDSDQNIHTLQYLIDHHNLKTNWLDYTRIRTLVQSYMIQNKQVYR